NAQALGERTVELQPYSSAQRSLLRNENGAEVFKGCLKRLYSAVGWRGDAMLECLYDCFVDMRYRGDPGAAHFREGACSFAKWPGDHERLRDAKARLIQHTG